MLDSGFRGKTFGRHILRLAQESHGPQSRMRYHALDALASDAARLNHEMLVVSAIHHFCPLRLIQVEVGRLPSTILPSTQSSKWNNGGRDCADGFMLQGSCFTGPVGTMTWPSLEAQGSSRDEDLATSFRASVAVVVVCLYLSPLSATGQQDEAFRPTIAQSNRCGPDRFCRCRHCIIFTDKILRGGLKPGPLLHRHPVVR
jgi:hypothetical protein